MARADALRGWIALVGLLVLVLTGCAGSKPITLMETPILYHHARLDPFAHLPEEKKTPAARIFYATNRTGFGALVGEEYGNATSLRLHLGTAEVRFGVATSGWDEIYQASITPERAAPVELELTSVGEQASLPLFGPVERPDDELDAEARAFAAAIDADLAASADHEVMIFVHGAKFSFDAACIMTAELDHFAGRDFVGIAYAWPSHQNILTYLTGIDVHRALNSTRGLRRLLEFVADHTRAEHINIMCYSAGGRVVSKALDEMRRAAPDSSADELRTRYRIGDVIFVAADVPVERFLERLPAMTDIARHVAVTTSDADGALKSASLLMRGGVRAGSQQAGRIEEEFVEGHGISNFEIIDLSYGQDERGFDIKGHHYWYRHSWASSDIMLLLRTALPARERGLRESHLKDIWYLPPDYPDRAREAAGKALGGTW